MKIVRTPTRASGGITSEEKMRMGALVEKWKSIAFQTGRCDVTKITDAIERLYASAGLKKPRVVVVPSPFVMACAYGVASCWWALRGKLKSVEATASDTEAATRAATFDATDAATDATDAATKQKKDWLVYLAKKFVGARFRAALEGVKKWADVYQGGNMWAMLPCYVEAMRDVIGLTGLPVWEQYKAWEDAATYGGFRVMHEKFCIVSDFPEVLKTDSRGRAHCATGPSHRWRDGFEIYHLNGIRVPKWLVMTDAGKIDPMLALNEKNVDVQREIIRKIGAERMLKAVGAKTVDTFVDCHTKGGNVYELKELLVGQISRKYLYYEHASVPGYWYAQAVPPNTKRAIHARAWILGMDSPEQKTDEEIRAFLPEVVS